MVPLRQTGDYLQLCGFSFLHPSIFLKDHGRLSLSHGCTVKIWSHMGQMKNNFGTLPLQLQQWRPCHWQDYGGYHGKQNHHCMVAGVELEKDASGIQWPWNVKSTIMKATSSQTQHKPGSSSSNWWLPTTSLLFTAQFIKGHFGPWYLVSVPMLKFSRGPLAVAIWSDMGPTNSRARKKDLGTLPLQLHSIFQWRPGDWQDEAGSQV